jgi:hypothetical protein
VRRTSSLEIIGLAIVGWLASLIHGPAGAALAAGGPSGLLWLGLSLAYLASGLIVAGAVLALVAIAWHWRRRADGSAGANGNEKDEVASIPEGPGEPEAATIGGPEPDSRSEPIFKAAGNSRFA